MTLLKILMRKNNPNNDGDPSIKSYMGCTIVHSIPNSCHSLGKKRMFPKNTLSFTRKKKTMNRREEEKNAREKGLKRIHIHIHTRAEHAVML